MSRKRGQLGLMVKTINEGRMPAVVTAADVAALTGLSHSEAVSVVNNAASRTEILTKYGRNEAGKQLYKVNPIAAQNYQGHRPLRLVNRARRNAAPVPVTASDLNPIDELLDAMAKAEPILKKMSEAYASLKKLGAL